MPEVRWEQALRGHLRTLVEQGNLEGRRGLPGRRTRQVAGALTARFDFRQTHEVLDGVGE